MSTTTTIREDLGSAAIPEAEYIARVKSDELRRHLAAEHGSIPTKSTATALDPIPAPLRERFRELAFKVSRGDQKAEAELTQLEAKIADAERLERRKAAAEAEEHRRAQEAADKRAQAERKAQERHHAQLVAKREASFAEIEAATETLAVAVKVALSADADLWAQSLQLGWVPETRTSSRITNYIAWKLGRSEAGLGDMPAPTHGSLREPLVSKEKK
jgi:hypothetical protein